MKAITFFLAVMVSAMASGQVNGVDNYVYGTKANTTEGSRVKLSQGEYQMGYRMEPTQSAVDNVMSETRHILEANDIEFSDIFRDQNDYAGDINSNEDILLGITIGEVVDLAWAKPLTDDTYLAVFLYIDFFYIQVITKVVEYSI